MTPLKAIRLKCIDCCGGQRLEPKRCSARDCPLWEYRLGHNPKRKGRGGAFSSHVESDEDYENYLDDIFVDEDISASETRSESAKMTAESVMK